MSEVSTEAEIPELVEDVPQPLAVGAQLRQAREARSLKIDDLAQSLKLSIRQVKALEDGEWQALPGTTFIRGFVRNYARLVDIDAQPLLEQLGGLLTTEAPRLALPKSKPTAMPQGGPVERRDYAFALIGLVFVLLALGVYLLAPSDLAVWRDQLLTVVSGHQAAPAAASEPVAANPQETMPPGATVQEIIAPQALDASGGSESPLNPASAETPAASVIAPTAAAAGEPVKSAALLVTVKKESWVEVRDAQGNVLLSQRVPDGSERQVDGVGPFAVVLGNAPGVALRFRGKDVDLAPHTKGDVARLKLE